MEPRTRPLRFAAAALIIMVCGAWQSGSAPETGFHRYLSAAQLQQVQQQASILLQPDNTIDLQVRSNAARQLVAMNAIESIAVLNDALRSGRTAPILAVLVAEAQRPNPSPDLLPALLAVLPNAPSDTIESIGVLLGRYSADGSACFGTINTMALDPQRPLEARLRAIEVMGEFRTHPERSIQALIAMLQRKNTSPALTEEALKSLTRLTGQTMSRDEWVKWWSNHDEQSSELLRQSIAALHRTTVAANHRLQQTRSEADRASARMIFAYQDLLPLLSLELQQAKVLELLDDSRADIRGFAVERVALMLGDGHDTPELQIALARLLADPDTANRRRVATLLNELDQEAVEVIVLTQIDSEEDPEVLKDSLGYLEATRSINAIDATRRLLADPQLRENAARTLRSILLANPQLDAQERMRIARAARTALAPSNWRTIAPLLVLTGNEDDLRSLEVILDNPDPEVRASVAEAFLQRGRNDVLLARADDAQIYPYALTAAQRDAKDLASLRLLLEMHPPADQAAAWADAVANVVEMQDPDRILEIDDMIGSIPDTDDDIRIRVLNASLSRGELNLQLRTQILKRLVPMLLEQDSPAAALTLIQGLDESMLDDELLDMKFISAIRARLYDDAALVHDDPDMWIKAYQDTIASRPESASDLLNEIVRRHNDRLTPQRRSLLGLAEDPLMPRDADLDSSSEDASEES